MWYGNVRALADICVILSLCPPHDDDDVQVKLEISYLVTSLHMYLLMYIYLGT